MIILENKKPTLVYASFPKEMCFSDNDNVLSDNK